MAEVPSVMGSLRPRGELQRQMSQLSIPTFSLAAGQRSDYPRATVQMARWLRALKPSIVHAHELDAVLVGLSAARLAGVPITVYTAHNESELPFHGIKLVAPEILGARVLADHVVAPSQSVAQAIKRYTHVPEAKLDVVPHGFDQTLWNPKLADGDHVRAEFGLGDSLVFGAVGRLFALKNYHALIEGFAQAMHELPQARLMIVGEGDPVELANLAASLGVAERVIFTGARDDIQDVFAAFDVFVHPSLAESFGLVIVEALLMGVPVLSAPVGIAPEAIIPGVSGVLFGADGTATTIAAGLQEMLNRRPQWPQFSAAGQQFAAQYSAETMANSYVQLYRRWLSIG